LSLRAFLILTGSELLQDKLDTNSLTIAALAEDWGIDLVGKLTVPDDRRAISEAFLYAAARAELIISSGGLGPTFDDLTREALAETLGLPLVSDPEAERQIRAYFSRRGAAMPETNLRQAQLPAGSRTLANHNGTAPGVLLTAEEKLYVLLPGPPGEMQPLWEAALAEAVIPRWQLERRTTPRVLTLHICGLGESAAAERLGTVLTQAPAGVRLGIFAHLGEISVKAENETDNPELLDAIRAGVMEKIGGHVYGENDDTLELVCHRALLDLKLSLAVAESCTGGWLSKTITDIPGSSAYYWGGLCTYDNRAKQAVFGVPLKRLEAFGAVSAEVAEDMARGLQRVSAADITLSITGVAGPDGGTEEKPVGLVYIGLLHGANLSVQRFMMTGNREMVRRRTVTAALTLLWKTLYKGDEINGK
jgi:nicotinamide-nucleotide amidase